MSKRSASRRNPWLQLNAWLVYAFLYLPIGVLIVFSFSASRYSLVWGGFTLDWYRRLFGDARLIQALFNSLTVATLATLLATFMGTACALALADPRRPGHSLWVAWLYLPVLMPELVQGIALLMLFVLVARIPLGIGTIIIAHTVFSIAYVALVVRTRLMGLDPHLSEAARDLGASEWRIFWRITLPLIGPGILGGALLAFTLSFDDFVIAFFVTGPGASTLPIEIYAMVKRGVTPEINAVASLILLISVVLIALSQRLQKPA
jgi:spermidine/putrescine transport system permease protein